MYINELDEYFNTVKEDLLEDLFSLIKIESISEENIQEGEFPYGKNISEALNKFLKISEKHGFYGKNIENKIAYIDFNDEEKQLDILVHLDVVPADAEEWSETEPFNPILKNGNIYGRGSIDNKGPAVASLYAMKAIKDLNIPISKNVRLIFGGHEETGSGDDIRTYYKYEKIAPMTISPDAHFPVTNLEKGALIGSFESKIKIDRLPARVISLNSGIRKNIIPSKAEAIVSGINIEEIKIIATKKERETGIKFILKEFDNNVKIEAIGKTMHTGNPEEANNALTGILSLVCSLPIDDCEGFKKLCQINKIFPHGDFKGVGAGINMEDNISGYLHVSPTILNYTEDKIYLLFDGKVPICATEENTIKVMEKLADKYGFEMTKKYFRKAHYISEDSYLVKGLLKCYEQYTGNKGYGISINGLTYVHDIDNGVAFGCGMPGVDNKIHQSDEFISLDDLITSAKIYAQVIINLCM